MLLNEQFQGTGAYGSDESPRIGGGGPTSSGSGVFTTGGGQPRFLSHQEARQQILGIQPQQADQGAQGGSQTPYGGFGELKSSVSGRGTEIGQGIQQAGRAFQEKVGGPASYNEGDLLAAIDPKTASEQRTSAMGSAREQLDATYGGPRAIDPDELAKIANQIGEYGLVARQVQTGGGLQGELKRRTPGMNEGMARFEAERMIQQDPGYRNQFIEDTQRAAALGVELQREQARAGELAAQRAAQEEQVAKQARGFLQEQKGGVYERLQAEAEAKNAQNAAAAAAYDAAIADPTKANLAALDPYSEANLQGFEEPRAMTAEAKAAYLDVMQRYAQAFPEIAAIPPLQKVITGRGEVWYGIPGPDGKVKDIRNVPGMSKETERHLMARQRELEERFYPRREKERLRKEEGEYANIAPLYYGPGGADPAQNFYQGRDPADYLSLDPGSTATMDILATSDDRTLVDNVNALLGESDRLAEGGDPFQAAMIAADVDKYLSDVEEDLEARKGELDEADAKFHKEVRKARHRYKKAKAKKTGQLAGAIIGGVLGPYLGPYGSIWGSALGGEIGEGVA